MDIQITSARQHVKPFGILGINAIQWTKYQMYVNGIRFIRFIDLKKKRQIETWISLEFWKSFFKSDYDTVHNVKSIATIAWFIMIFTNSNL